MNQEIKRRWVEALRSGEYKQGREALKCQGQFCCLGVLCDLHAKETNTKWVDHINKDFSSDYLDQDSVLPIQVMDWAGTQGSDPVITTRESISRCITHYNDGERYDFIQLADLIEQYL